MFYKTNNMNACSKRKTKLLKDKMIYKGQFTQSVFAASTIFSFQ